MLTLGNFVKDLASSKKGEQLVTKYFENLVESPSGGSGQLTPYTLTGINNTKAWDLKFERDFNYQYGDHHQEILVEVKTDFFPRVANMAIEVACRGKPSGLMTSKSDYYSYVFYNLREVWTIKTNILKNIMDLAHQVSIGGDKGSNTVVFLLDREKVREHFDIVTFEKEVTV